MQDFKRGLRCGVPIGMGYLSVAFTFGVMAIAYGLTWWEATLISMTTLTSAGQFASLSMMPFPGQTIPILVSQLTINIRYCFMSVSLSQHLEERFRGVYRWLLGYFITDEIFAVASAERCVTRSFFLGLAVVPYFGWSCGTLAGALLGSVLPQRLMSAVGLAIYGMFIAVVAPEAKDSRNILISVLLAGVISSLFYFLPPLSHINSGLAISAAAIAAAVCGAVFFPVRPEQEG